MFVVMAGISLTIVSGSSWDSRHTVDIVPNQTARLNLYIADLVPSDLLLASGPSHYLMSRALTGT